MSAAALDLSARLARLLRRMQSGGDGVRREQLGDVDFPDGLVRRPISVYLPPGYRKGEPAPLLFALDGQAMERWGLPGCLRDLARAGDVRLPVVVAVPASAARRDEYGIAGVPDYAGRGRLAGAFQGFLAGPLLDEVRRRYGCGLEASRTGVFGASLGGLSAFHTAWRHPDRIGVAGVFSGSLWWREDNTDAVAQQRTRIAHRLVRESAVRPAVRLWFQAGTEDETEDRDGNGVIDAIQDTTELIDALAARGFTRGGDVVYRESPGGRHEEETWARELPAFLRWAWPAT